MATFTTLKGFSQIGDSSLSEVISTNLIHFLNWGFLDKGAYFNVNIPQSGSYGGDESRLRPVTNPYYTDGQVWEGFRKSWVWESGVAQTPNPIQVSGVFIDNVFQAIGAGHHVDYINGQIVFDTAIATTSVVRAEYSYRWIQTYDGDSIPWFRQTQFESQRIDTDKFFNMGSGDLSTMAQTRVQLPAIIIELVDGSYAPRDIGSSLGQYAINDVIFHIMAEDGGTANKLADYLSQQTEKTIYLFSPDSIAASGMFPLNFQGSIASGAMIYPDMVRLPENGGFRTNKLRFFDGIKQRTNKVHNNLYIKPVRMSTEVIITGV